MVLFYIIATMDDQAVIRNASGIFLFGFTYLYVSVTNVDGFDSSRLGWYCLRAAIMAVVYSLFNFFYFGDSVFGVIWLLWSFLWALFFVFWPSKEKPLVSPAGSLRARREPSLLYLRTCC